jgi:two-component system, cell cycle sensor histidine kinase and response regulator CckA
MRMATAKNAAVDMDRVETGSATLTSPEERLREAEKMEVIGRLAGSVVHDFNNILTGILLYCDLVLDGMPVENQLRPHIEEIRIAGEQGSALTQQLLAIARKQALQLRPVHLNEVLASMQKFLCRLIGEQIALRTVPGSELGMVLADPAQLRQVILNLALNARDAMPRGGQITISTHEKFMPADGEQAVSLIVEDTGSGMDAETRTHLFEPFYTTKESGRGTELGLATVDRIVTEAGGTILVESDIGRGTRIEVLLPVMSE